MSVTFDRHVQRLNQENSSQGPMSSQEDLEADDGFVLINHEPTSAAQQSRRNTSHSNPNGIAPTIRKLQRGRPRKPLELTRTAPNVIARRNPSDQSPFMPIELSLSAFQAPICVTFLVQNFLGHLDTGRKSLLPAWDVNNVSGTARVSVIALALTFFGKAHHQQNIIEQGADCYGKALLKLRHNLFDPNAMWSSSVLLSAILLARYELVASTGSEGWIQHAGGVERLFKLRGPRRHQSLEERHIFEAARPIIVIKAITDCKRTFLDQDDWLTLPWAQDPLQKSNNESTHRHILHYTRSPRRLQVTALQHIICVGLHDSKEPLQPLSCEARSSACGFTPTSCTMLHQTTDMEGGLG